MLSVKTAAARAGVSAALVYGWVASGLLAHYRLGANGRRGKIGISEADLDAALETMKRNGRPEAPPPVPKRQPVKLRHLRARTS